MIDKKTAFEVLGLKNKASQNEIERRFTILLKKYRSESAKGASEIDIEKVTAAYNLLMGYVTEDPAEAAGKPNPMLKKMGIDEKKAKNFIYYYKFHVIIGLIVLIAAFFFIKDAVTRVNPDVNIVFIGNIYCEDSEAIGKKIEKEITDIKKASVDQVFLYPKEDPGQESTQSIPRDAQQEYAMNAKATVLIAAGKIDLYILDRDEFDLLSRQGGLVNLDGLTDRLGIKRDDYKDLITKTENDKTEHLYGIDVSKSNFFSDLGIMGEEKIAALGISGKFQDNAIKVLRVLLK